MITNKMTKMTIEIQQADIDDREERVYRRPPTYLIIASKIVRPASIYQVDLCVHDDDDGDVDDEDNDADDDEDEDYWV